MKKFNKVGLITSLLLITIGFNVLSAQAAGPLPVNLLSASNFSILAKTAITTTGATSVIGNIGLSPEAAIGITGFGLIMDPSNKFSTSALVNGKIYAPDYALPTPSTMTKAISAMEAAYTDAAGRTIPTAIDINSGSLSSSTSPFLPGLYKWNSDVTITDSITLNGNATDVWIFQTSGNLSLASAGSVATGTKIILNGGANSSNIFWQVGGGNGATLGTYSTFNGNILAAKQIILQTGAVLNGRALSQTQVTLDANIVSSNPVSLHIVKVVDNGNRGTAVPSDFMIHVSNSNLDVVGSPLTGTSTPGNSYNLSAGNYTVSEDANSSYTSTFSGDCDAAGNVTLVAADKTCTVTNTYIPVVPTTGGGSYTPFGVTNSQIAAKCISDKASTSLSWLSNYAADSRVVYDTVSHNITLGSAPSYGYAYSTITDATQVTGHNQTISNLNPNTTYYFRAVSNNAGTEILGEEIAYTENLICTTTIPTTTDFPTTPETVAPTSTPVVIAPVNPEATTTATVITPIENQTSSSTPSFPSAGVEPEKNNNWLNMVKYLGIFGFALAAVVLIPKRAKI